MAEQTPPKKLRLELDLFDFPPPAAPACVLLRPANVTVRLEQGESIFEAAKRVGVEIPSTCGGKGTCGRCRILLPLPARDATYVERQHIDRGGIARGIRLSCRSRPLNDVEVTVLPEPNFPSTES